MFKTKTLFLALLAVLGWTVIFFMFLDWWAVHAASERATTTVGLLVGEAERTAPTLIYFFAVGLLLGRALGLRTGGVLTLVTAAAAVVIQAIATQQVFSDGIGLMAVVVLAIDYLLPLLCGIAGVATSGLWRSTAGGGNPP
ncbi:MAG TPA: hypothetical protein VEH03_07405 [Burkholderiales bacterium]|nr:hypothetical protein [Burkholderiales bacterium]